MRLLLLLTALAACSPPPVPGPGAPDVLTGTAEDPVAAAGDGPARLCLRVPEPALAGVRAGLAGWDAVLGPWRLLEEAGPGKPCDAVVEQSEEADSPCLEGMSDCADGIGGLDLARPRGHVWLLRGRYESSAAFVTMHELGHLLGLGHEDGTVMEAEPSGKMARADWACPDPRTVSRLEAHLGLGLEPGCEEPRW